MNPQRGEILDVSGHPSPRGERKRVSVVVPVHNEEGNIDELFGRLEKVLGGLPYDHEIIFVDDGSRDRSLERIDKIAVKTPAVKYISLSRNFGHQYALTAGLDYASGDAVISMDSDLQHPPELIPTLLAHWEEGYQVVYTIRKSTKDVSLFKRITAAVFYRLMSSMSQIRIEANTSDFRLMDRQVCDVLRHSREQSRFYRGMIQWVGFRQRAVEFEADARFSGEPSYTVRRMVRFAVDGILSYSYIPLYMILWFSLCLALLSSMYMIFALYQRFVSGQALPGQTSILLSVLVIGTVQLLGTSIAGVYAYKAYQESKARPLYVVARLKGFDR